MTQPKLQRSMNVRTYSATTHAIVAAYMRLKVAARTAEYGELPRIRKATNALKEAAEALRIQACHMCTVHGYYPVAAKPGTMRTCLHPLVPNAFDDIVEPE